MKIAAENEDGTPAGIVLSEVYSGVGIRTDMGLFGIAERDGGIEVMLGGKTVWTSHEIAPSDLPETGNIELPSGTVIECDGPHELCISVIGSVINHRTRLFYNLDDAQDRRVLADQVIKTWNNWAATEEAVPLSPNGPGVRLPDGSGACVASFPLPKDHWLYAEGYNEPPMPQRVGVGSKRNELADQIQAATRYAIRASTMNGKETNFDPDAMVQNMIFGLLGY